MIYRKKNDQEIYENIQNYISAILNLYTNICKGRNISSLKKLEDIGLNSDHIFKCLQINLNNNLKRGYMRLLESLFIDVEPYQSVCLDFSPCFIWKFIGMINLKSYSYKWTNAELYYLDKEMNSEEDIAPNLSRENTVKQISHFL